MKTLITTLIAISTLFKIQAQDITGDWNGLLDVQGMQLRLVFHITTSDTGLSATMDSPDQGATGIPVSSIVFKDDTLDLQVAPLGIRYRGNLEADGKFSGTFNQAGLSLPLNLTREIAQKKAYNRPQEPTAPYPYRSEEVTFESTGGIQLAGTLTLPQTGTGFTAAILISGSGPQNRDEEFMTHRPFLVLADHLTRKGIAVLRYDDRGTAASTGSFQGATSVDLAQDVKAAINFLKTNQNISEIGLIGHSEGGLIAPMVASEDQEVDFIVLMAGPGVPGDQVLLKQHEMLAMVQGKSQEEIVYGMQSAKAVFDMVKRSDNTENLKQELRSYLEKAYENPLTELPQGTEKEELIKMEVTQLTNPWMQYFLKYDPAAALNQTTCPVLAINGEKDVQVSADNLEHIKDAVLSGGNQQVTIKQYPGMNHLFQPCESGAVSEYATIEQTMAPEVLEDISSWILALKR